MYNLLAFKFTYIFAPGKGTHELLPPGIQFSRVPLQRNIEVPKTLRCPPFLYSNLKIKYYGRFNSYL